MQKKLSSDSYKQLATLLSLLEPRVIAAKKDSLYGYVFHFDEFINEHYNYLKESTQLNEKQILARLKIIYKDDQRFRTYTGMLTEHMEKIPERIKWSWA